MNDFVKITGVCSLTAILAACGGSSDNNNSSGGGNGSGGGGSSGGTPVASRTGEASYAGTFTAKTSDTLLGSSAGWYTGGDFSGQVVADADFDKDQIDIDLIGTPKADVIESYKAEFDDVKIENGQFAGEGSEDISVRDKSIRKGLHTMKSPTKVSGAFNAAGDTITGATETVPDYFDVQSVFTATEK